MRTPTTSQLDKAREDALMSEGNMLMLKAYELQAEAGEKFTEALAIHDAKE